MFTFPSTPRPQSFLVPQIGCSISAFLASGRAVEPQGMQSGLTAGLADVLQAILAYVAVRAVSFVKSWMLI